MRIRNVAGAAVVCVPLLLAGCAQGNAHGSVNCDDSVTGQQIMPGARITHADGTTWQCHDGKLRKIQTPAPAVLASYGLPGWFQWQYATWATTREVCGKHATHRAVVAWSTAADNDSSIVICRNGRFSQPS